MSPHAASANTALPHAPAPSGMSSEYVRELMDRLQLRRLLLAGAASDPAAPVEAGYFNELRDRVRKAAKPAAEA